MVISALAMIPERRADMDFADTPYYYESSIIIYNKPNPDDDAFFLFSRVSDNGIVTQKILILRGGGCWLAGLLATDSGILVITCDIAVVSSKK